VSRRIGVGAGFFFCVRSCSCFSTFFFLALSLGSAASLSSLTSMTSASHASLCNSFRFLPLSFLVFSSSTISSVPRGWRLRLDCDILGDVCLVGIVLVLVDGGWVTDDEPASTSTPKVRSGSSGSTWSGRSHKRQGMKMALFLTFIRALFRFSFVVVEDDFGVWTEECVTISCWVEFKNDGERCWQEGLQ
jgi:hypothetical protein